jgi:acetyl esterase/lipase
MVVSPEYPKAPHHRFPVAIDCLVDIINSVFDDESLPFDRSKVAIGGFSAGANLAMAVSRHPSLQGRIAGLMAFYPPVNFTAKAVDIAAREAELAGGAAAAVEVKSKSGGVLPQDGLTMFSWGYLPEGQDLRDPRLSPTLAKRDSLPKKIYIVGCELDLLCAEAEKMAIKMAGPGGSESENKDCWERNGVKWERVLGEDHGKFTM